MQRHSLCHVLHPYLALLQEEKGEDAESKLHRRVFATKPLTNTLDPTWPPIEIDTLKLCNNDVHQRLVIQCYDHDARSEDDLIGALVTSLEELRMRGHGGQPLEKSLVLKDAMRLPGYQNSGKLRVLGIKLTALPPGGGAATGAGAGAGADAGGGTRGTGAAAPAAGGSASVGGSESFSASVCHHMAVTFRVGTTPDR